MRALRVLGRPSRAWSPLHPHAQGQRPLLWPRGLQGVWGVDLGPSASRRAGVASLSAGPFRPLPRLGVPGGSGLWPRGPRAGSGVSACRFLLFLPESPSSGCPTFLTESLIFKAFQSDFPCLFSMTFGKTSSNLSSKLPLPGASPACPPCTSLTRLLCIRETNLCTAVAFIPDAESL